MRWHFNNFRPGRSSLHPPGLLSPPLSSTAGSSAVRNLLKGPWFSIQRPYPWLDRDLSASRSTGSPFLAVSPSLSPKTTSLNFGMLRRCCYWTPGAVWCSVCCSLLKFDSLSLWVGPIPEICCGFVQAQRSCISARRSRLCRLQQI